MKCKNISKSNINLESGVLAPGKSGEATFDEAQLLITIGRLDIVPPRKRTPRKVAKDE